MTPKVSFIIPVRNEEHYIKKCIDSLLALDYPQDKIELLFAEGTSTDKTRKILEDYTKKYDNIKILDNPTGNTAIGRNICIKNATGDYVMNYSGHATGPPGFLKILVNKLQQQPPEIAGVGCSNISPEKQTFSAKVAGAAFLGFMAGSGIFMQNTVFNNERYVDHMSFTCYRKEILEKIGGFDPEFWCGQDAELDIRVKKSGYKILYTPKTFVYHYKRNTIPSLFKQLYRYGIARIKMAIKHPGTLRVFHLFPSLFILGVIGLVLLWGLDIIPTILMGIFALIYLVLCFIS